MDSKCHNPFIYLTKRAIRIIKADRLVEFLNLIRYRLSCKQLQSHWFVIAYKRHSNSQLPTTEMKYEVIEITTTDNDEIDELTEVDEWKISKSCTFY